MSQDIRVLLIKLADRLHNMRTLHHITNPEKRERIARETMETYAPLAERIGMQRMKDELEDLAFSELYSDAQESIVARLAFLREQGEGLVPSIVGELKQTLADEGIKAEVFGREKKPCSIWRKMQHQNVEFGQLFDIMAFRIVVDDVADCYRVLGTIHGHYPCVPGRFKDYISTPKRNGYRSLHTGIIGPEQRRIEIQIRTKDMHEVAELGVAAHWHYKQGESQTAGPEYRWLRELLDILDNASGPEEFLEHTKLDLFQDQVFCFTPKGDLIALPSGATAVDFAYEVHSEVGDSCVGARINGRIMPLRTALKHGDQVEIVTSGPGAPSPAWEQFVVTGKARARIRRFVRSKQRTEYRRMGEAIIHKAFQDEGFEPADNVLEEVLDRFELSGVDDLFVAVGEGLFTGTDVIRAVFKQGPGGANGAKLEKIAPRPLGANGEDNGVNAIPIRGLIPGMAVHYSSCCHPLPGDRIVGILTTGKGVAIHTIDCQTLESFHDTPERWLDVAWDLGDEKADGHVGRLNVVVANERGGLASLATVVAKHQGNIINLNITSRSSEFFEMTMDIEVADSKHLNDIMAALRGTAQVSSVERAWEK